MYLFVSLGSMYVCPPYYAGSFVFLTRSIRERNKKSNPLLTEIKEIWIVHETMCFRLRNEPVDQPTICLEPRTRRVEAQKRMLIH